MKFSEISALSDEQLVHREMSLERTMMGHLLRHRLGKLENTSLLRNARRDIARVQTALTAREHAAGLAKGSLRATHGSSFIAEAAVPQAEAGGGFLKGLLDNQEPAS